MQAFMFSRRANQRVSTLSKEVPLALAENGGVFTCPCSQTKVLSLFSMNAEYVRNDIDTSTGQVNE
jgi:hypothetical protein